MKHWLTWGRMWRGQTYAPSPASAPSQRWRVAQGWLPALGQWVPFRRLLDGQALHFPLDPIRTEHGAVFSVAQM